jgi:uncharacterized protein
MYTLPQEIEVWYIIPGIRRELARCLIKKYDVTYDKVGKILGISKAAISQYLKGKRAAKIKLHPKIQEEVIKACERLIESKSNSMNEILDMLKLIKEKGYFCEVCGKVVEGKLHNCKQLVPMFNELE